MAKKYILDGYSFANAAELERAKKEQETIRYLTANTNMADMKAVYKVYKLSVEKKSFQTIFGIQYLGELRKRLVGSGTVEEDLLEPIPIIKSGEVASARQTRRTGMDSTEKYKLAYEKAKSGSTIKTFLIAVLFVVIIAMTVITYKSQYSVFTYFTDYKENMRNEILNEYEKWDSELKEREQKVEEKEKAQESDTQSKDSKK